MAEEVRRLSVADEQSRAPFNKPSAVPKEFAWPSLLARDGGELETHYRHVLESLEDSANLPAPEMIAAEIAEDLQAAMEPFFTITKDLRK